MKCPIAALVGTQACPVRPRSFNKYSPTLAVSSANMWLFLFGHVRIRFTFRPRARPIRPSTALYSTPEQDETASCCDVIESTDDQGLASQIGLYASATKSDRLLVGNRGYL